MEQSRIIAVDFGTSYSGYAFNIKTVWKDSDLQVRMWGEKPGLLTPKTPTCILLSEKGEFLKFGYEARTTYINMKGEEAKKLYFFEDFKMSLYGRKINRDFTIKAANGEEMTALKVFAESLRFLKDDALKNINSNSDSLLCASDFTWVLTVPAIWDQSAKQFMREAAIQAGLMIEGADNLLITLEPEAASLWCMKLPAEGFITQNTNSSTLDQTPGSQYVVVDCGGGTIDITVHEVLREGTLKELLRASGNNLGGQTVDRKFKEFLKEIFCDGVWEEFEKKHPSDVQRISNEFTRLKQADEDVSISCPFNLGTLSQRKQNIENFFDSVSGASWDDGEILISREKLRSFFKESLQGITKSLREIFNKDLHIDYLLLVGGFAQSQILYQHIIDLFGDQCEVLRPSKPQEAVLRGAVEFGRKPQLVSSRKSPFTYGFAVFEPFDESRHKPEKKVRIEGEEWCGDVFRKLVEKDEDIHLMEFREHILRPVKENQTHMTVRFYQAKGNSPQYVDDEGVKEVGSYEIEMPDIRGGRKHQVRLEIMIGSTEITARVMEVESGSTGSTRLDFLTEEGTSSNNQPG